MLATAVLLALSHEAAASQPLATVYARPPVQSQATRSQPTQSLAAAQPLADIDKPDVLERSFYKMLVFEGSTNALDLALFASVLGGHLYVGPAFLAINATAAAALYYGHEVAWGYLGPTGDEFDTKANILKGITFRLASSTRAFAVGYAFTGDPVAAVGFTVFSAIGETVVYVSSEYGWAFYDRLRQRNALSVASTGAPLVPVAFASLETVR